MNFILCEMTYLRYFIPLIIEGNKRGIKSNVFWSKNSKYNDPCHFLNELIELSEQACFKLIPLSAMKPNSDITFMVEGVGLSQVKHAGKKVVITSMADFATSYDNYVNSVDIILMASKFLAEFYGKINSKNVYCGSPKYDVDIKKKDTILKYSLPSEKNVLVLFPRLRSVGYASYLDKIDLKAIYSLLKRMGYAIIVKTRGKDIVPNCFRGDRYFEDFSWFPHSTMELIDACDFVVNFDSTAIKECVMLQTPLINFNIKDATKYTGKKIPFHFLYDYDYCFKFRGGFIKGDMESAINKIRYEDYSEAFSKVTHKYLFNREGVCSKILDVVFKDE